MNFIKRYLLIISALIAIFILAACSPKTEKAYYQIFEDNSVDSHITYQYQEDRLTKQTEENITVYAANNIIDAEQAKEKFPSRRQNLKKIKGVNYKISYGEDRLTEVVEIDYTKADLTKLAPQLGLSTTEAENIGFISFKEVQKHIEEEGYKKVKNGKFQKLQ